MSAAGARRFHMGDEFENKVEGDMKEGAGKVTGDPSLEAEGAGQKAVGNVEEGARKVGGAIEEGVGKVTGDPGKQVEGEAKQA
ncbi:MAG TPA: CsbD family protein [Candidatus Dormibacteraeota bacterium]|nr:CsbD family protein [Candidatus Dormibacteraeota bacterium]